MIIESKSGKNTLTFDEDKHVYTLNGNPVYGVTTINKQGYPMSPKLLGWLMSKGRVKAKKESKEAADIGTLVHDYANLFEKDGKISEELHNKINTQVNKNLILSCIKKFRRWKRQNLDEIIGSEEIVASVNYNFAGKYDRLSKRNGLVVLSDFKTSSGIYVDQFVQLAGYTIALKEWKNISVDAVEILRFGKEDGTFEPKIVTDQSLIRDFQEQFLRNIFTFNFVQRWG